ncbi:tRNA-splicing endonuclease subunit Sen34-like isoform X1 [Argiope bruennichi]|nr:tRNA-splicing endonuclease subunit Sen34-like isoform X1 [Argiope bruennichi]
MINLYLCNGKACVWNVKDIMTLREKYRIVGYLIGSYPEKPFQLQAKWLPLKLMSEETRLLIDKGIAQLVSLSKDLPDSAIIQQFYEQRDKLCEEQISIYKENRKKQILEKADEIFEGKKRKYLEALEKKKKAQKLSETSAVTTAESSSVQETDAESKSFQGENSSNSTAVLKENVENDPGRDSAIEGEKNMSSESQECNSESINIDKQAIIDAELAKVTSISKELCLVQLFTECPWKTKFDPVNWRYPSTEREKLRCTVYRDLWEKKYYITSGVKFGGDFLAYEGDPLKYHALFIIVCKCHGERFQGSDLVVYGRLGHQVKKTVVLATQNEQGKVEYISLSWENEMT